eukprot:TRINITY_DN19533_c0_g1_i1.p1 TRINITY_DN19533_c0_g1~~TRINITY_DN19533_c0_g1_i1.p1  ORF type:complete len:619 (+),score=236.26 TRINITY_DN19533_c0_g1_i1:133-1989(+)
MAAPGTPAAPSAAAAAGAAAAALLQRQLAQDGPGGGWTEHQTGDGRKFYFHEDSQTSTWDKPEVLMTAEERANNTKWSEYRIWDGRVFYHNRESKVSCWRMPPELRKMREGISGIDDRPLATTVAEKRRSFINLMKKKGIDATWTWGRVDDDLAEEPEAEALTEAQRKQCFAELVSTCLRARQIAEREKQRSAAHALERLIEERFGSPEHGGTTYEDAKRLLQQEEAWLLVKHETKRQEVFENVMERLEQKQNKLRVEKSSERVVRLARFMGSDPELKRSRLRWKDALRILKKRDELQEEDPPLEALRVWASLRELKPATEHEAENKAKNKPDSHAMRDARQRRDAFMTCLKDYVAKGVLDQRTSWTDFYAQAESENRVVSLREGRGATAMELFDEFQEEMRGGMYVDLIPEKKEEIKEEEKDGPPAKRQRLDDDAAAARRAAAAAAAVGSRTKDESASALDAIIDDGDSSSSEEDDDDPLMGLANAAAAAKVAEAKAATARIAALEKVEEEASSDTEADAGAAASGKPAAAATTGLSLFEEAAAEAEAAEQPAGGGGLSIFEEAAAEVDAETPAPKKKYAAADLMAKKVDELKALCKKHGLPSSGRKQELVDRLAAV